MYKRFIYKKGPQSKPVTQSYDNPRNWEDPQDWVEFKSKVSEKYIRDNAALLNKAAKALGVDKKLEPNDVMTWTQYLQVELMKSPAVQRLVGSRIDKTVDYTFGPGTRRRMRVALFEKGKIRLAKKLMAAELSLSSKAQNIFAYLKENNKDLSQLAKLMGVRSMGLRKLSDKAAVFLVVDIQRKLFPDQAEKWNGSLTGETLQAIAKADLGDSVTNRLRHRKGPEVSRNRTWTEKTVEKDKDGTEHTIEANMTGKSVAVFGHKTTAGIAQWLENTDSFTATNHSIVDYANTLLKNYIPRMKRKRIKPPKLAIVFLGDPKYLNTDADVDATIEAGKKVEAGLKKWGVEMVQFGYSRPLNPTDEPKDEDGKTDRYKRVSAFHAKIRENFHPFNGYKAFSKAEHIRMREAGADNYSPAVQRAIAQKIDKLSASEK